MNIRQAKKILAHKDRLTYKAGQIQEAERTMTRYQRNKKED
ncbi:MAG: hypothetical protein ACI85I_002161 [Arenicella sp.]|jgi:hypothetical protein